MALKSELMASSMPAAAANRVGLDALANITQTGASQAAAAGLVSNFSKITAGTGGVIITQTHAMHCIINASGSSANIYPPVGSTMNGTLNAAFAVGNGKTAIIFSGGTDFIANLSA